MLRNVSIDGSSETFRHLSITLNRCKPAMLDHRPWLNAPRHFARKMTLAACRVSLGGDLHERSASLAVRLPLSKPRHNRLQSLRAAGVLFVHVPKCAGMAISQALYGAQIKHGSIRWYHHAAPDLVYIPSFAVVREPVERFLSAYRYAVAGGSADNRVSSKFYDRYRAFRCVDDAIDHVEQAGSVYRIDHIFRPQFWYLTDRRGKIVVDRLFSIDDADLPKFIVEMGGNNLSYINRGSGIKPEVTANQEKRIRKIYARDCIIFSSVRSGLASSAPVARRGIG